MGKSNPLPRIATSYLKIFHKADSDDIYIVDILVQIGLPLVVAFLALIAPADIMLRLMRCNEAAITALSIVSSFMCALAVLVFQLRLQLSATDGSSTDHAADPTQPSGVKALRVVKFIDELFYAALWAILTGFATVGLMVLSQPSVLPYFINRITEALLLGFLLNFILTVGICLKRLYCAYSLMSRKDMAKSKPERKKPPKAGSLDYD